MKVLEHKIIWITGVLGNLGLSAVSMFLERGATIIGCDLKPLTEARAIQELMMQYGDNRLHYLQGNMTEEAAVIEMIVYIEQKFGRLDGVYHNVYSNIWKPVLELSLEEWEHSIRGSLTSAFLVNKYAISLMIKNGGGSIVNTSSILGQIVSPGCLPYGAAKAGINQFTRVIAADYASEGIRANVLVPGDFRSASDMSKQSEAEKSAIRKHAWLGRSGSSDEINEAACFLLSDASSYVTAALLQVDGGFHQ